MMFQAFLSFVLYSFSPSPSPPFFPLLPLSLPFFSLIPTLNSPYSSHKFYLSLSLPSPQFVPRSFLLFTLTLSIFAFIILPSPSLAEQISNIFGEKNQDQIQPNFPQKNHEVYFYDIHYTTQYIYYHIYI